MTRTEVSQTPLELVETLDELVSNSSRTWYYDENDPTDKMDECVMCGGLDIHINDCPIPAMKKFLGEAS